MLIWKIISPFTQFLEAHIGCVPISKGDMLFWLTGPSLYHLPSGGNLATGHLLSISQHRSPRETQLSESGYFGFKILTSGSLLLPSGTKKLLQLSKENVSEMRTPLLILLEGLMTKICNVPTQSVPATKERLNKCTCTYLFQRKLASLTLWV